MAQFIDSLTPPHHACHSSHGTAGFGASNLKLRGRSLRVQTLPPKKGRKDEAWENLGDGYVSISLSLQLKIELY